jgi:hypothetical protein
MEGRFRSLCAAVLIGAVVLFGLTWIPDWLATSMATREIWRWAFLPIATGAIGGLWPTATSWFARLRNVSGAFSIGAAIAIVAGLAITEQRPRRFYGFGDLMLDRNQADAYLDRWSPQDGPDRIPTGVQIQAVNFLTGNDVDVAGYVWQKIPHSIKDPNKQGVIFAEALKAYDLREVFRREEAEYTLVLWRFQVTLRQLFFYHRYPFDRQNVWIRLWSRDFGQGTLLVPDFDSYPSPFVVHRLAGLDREFVQDGWKADFTSFSYGLIDYSTSFGLNTYRDRDLEPELYFNVGLKRDFADPLINRIIPLIVVATLLFLVLKLVSREEQLRSLSGFNGFALLGYCAALFFVVVLYHDSLRDQLSPQSVMYIDGFYFLLYLMILLVSTQAILFTSQRETFLLHVSDNKVPSLLYWPVLLGSVLLMTVLTFAPVGDQNIDLRASQESELDASLPIIQETNERTQPGQPNVR